MSVQQAQSLKLFLGPDSGMPPSLNAAAPGGKYLLRGQGHQLVNCFPIQLQNVYFQRTAATSNGTVELVRGYEPIPQSNKLEICGVVGGVYQRIQTVDISLIPLDPLFSLSRWCSAPNWDSVNNRWIVVSLASGSQTGQTISVFAVDGSTYLMSHLGNVTFPSTVVIDSVTQPLSYYTYPTDFSPDQIVVNGGVPYLVVNSWAGSSGQRRTLASINLNTVTLVAAPKVFSAADGAGTNFGNVNVGKARPVNGVLNFWGGYITTHLKFKMLKYNPSTGAAAGSYTVDLTVIPGVTPPSGNGNPPGDFIYNPTMGAIVCLVQPHGNAGANWAVGFDTTSGALIKTKSLTTWNNVNIPGQVVDCGSDRIMVLKSSRLFTTPVAGYYNFSFSVTATDFIEEGVTFVQPFSPQPLPSIPPVVNAANSCVLDITSTPNGGIQFWTTGPIAGQVKAGLTKGNILYKTVESPQLYLGEFKGAYSALYIPPEDTNIDPISMSVLVSHFEGGSLNGQLPPRNYMINLAAPEPLDSGLSGQGGHKGQYMVAATTHVDLLNSGCALSGPGEILYITDIEEVMAPPPD